MTMEADILWHISSSESEVRRTPLTSGAPVIIRSSASLISLGTELTVARGIDNAENFESMVLPYMQGSFALPIAYGYSLVGEVVESPGGKLNGKRVHVMHPHASMAAVYAHDCFPIPATIPDARATLASNMETAVNAVWDSEVKAGDHAVVLGFGLIGSLVARLLHLQGGVDCSIVEVSKTRTKALREMGFTEYMPGMRSADAVFHCTGSETGLQKAIDIAGFEARIVELSWYGSRSVSLDLGSRFHMNRLRIISSQVSHVARVMRKKVNKQKRKEEVFRLLENPVFDAHIDEMVSLREAAELFNTWRNTKPEKLGYVIEYGD